MTRNFTPGFFLFVVLFSLSTFLSAQQKPDINSFYAKGNAQKVSDQCFRLTDAYNWQGGSVWHREPISLSAPFEMELNLMLGCEDHDGADGMFFVFHTEPNYNGYKGEGIGFGGLAPSLGIEIDTWQNFHLQDPYYDHLAVMYDGNVNHYYGLTEPVRIDNVEDCALHAFKISWNPKQQLLSVSLDGKQYIALKYDILKNIFNNNDRVYWGVTAATGGHNNRHEICFEKLEFEIAYPKEFDRHTTRKILKGDVFPLEEVKFNAGKTDLLPISKRELDKLVDLLDENPEMSVDVIGHTDSSGDAKKNKQLSKKRAEQVEEYLVEKGIDRKRINAKGYGENYPLASNSTSAGRLKNRRIEIIVSKPIP